MAERLVQSAWLAPFLPARGIYAPLMEDKIPVGFIATYFPFVVGWLYAFFTVISPVGPVAPFCVILALFNARQMVTYASWMNKIDCNFSWCPYRQKGMGTLSMLGGFATYTICVGFGRQVLSCARSIPCAVPLILMVFPVYTFELVNFPWVTFGSALAWGELVGWVWLRMVPIPFSTQFAASNVGSATLLLIMAYTTWRTLHEVIFKHRHY
jgi:hypothetical protein